jgi:hypothetical protein
MDEFVAQSNTAPVAPPDPFRHVAYTPGMVLGAADFDQEFAYLAGHGRWAARALLGYGTACGLRVTTDTDAVTGPRVVVAPGTAVGPDGCLIRVTPAQCASLNAWLAKPENAAALVPRLLGSPPHNVLRLHVVLSYRERPTDPVPIAGEPCRSADLATAPSRLADDYRLELRLDPPGQTEEDAVRDFADWLAGLRVSEGPGPFASRSEFEAAIRAAAHLTGSPPFSPPGSPPDFLYGSPPTTLRIKASDAPAFLRAAIRIWVTELRPLWLAAGQTAAGDPPADGALLLAELDVPVVNVVLTGRWKVDDATPVTVVEARRPVLAPLRLLQEWAARGDTGHVGGGSAAGMFDASGAATAAPFYAVNGLTCTRLGATSVFYYLRFPAYDPAARYAVSGTVLTDAGAGSDPQSFEVVLDPAFNNQLAAAGIAPGTGIGVRVMRATKQPITVGFSVEIRRI